MGVTDRKVDDGTLLECISAAFTAAFALENSSINGLGIVILTVTLCAVVHYIVVEFVPGSSVRLLVRASQNIININ